LLSKRMSQLRKAWFQKQSTRVHQLQDELQNQYDLSRTIRDMENQPVLTEEHQSARLERYREFHAPSDFANR